MVPLRRAEQHARASPLPAGAEKLLRLGAGGLYVVLVESARLSGGDEFDVRVADIQIAGEMCEKTVHRAAKQIAEQGLIGPTSMTGRIVVDGRLVGRMIEWRTDLATDLSDNAAGRSKMHQNVSSGASSSSSSKMHLAPSQHGGSGDKSVPTSAAELIAGAMRPPTIQEQLAEAELIRDRVRAKCSGVDDSLARRIANDVVFGRFPLTRFDWLMGRLETQKRKGFKKSPGAWLNGVYSDEFALHGRKENPEDVRNANEP